LQKVNRPKSKDYIKYAELKMLEKRKDNCMVGRHKFIFSPPFSVQEAQLGGISPTGHTR
jgi:hypothetical protein